MILVALGSSLPFCGVSPQGLVERAVRAIDAVAPVAAASGLYRSPAWPDPKDPPFINAVISLERGPGPEALLASLHAIEAGFGRRRSARNAPRTLDLDLLDYDGLIRTWPGLTLPHPRVSARPFVVAPLVELAPDWRHPETGESAAELRAQLDFAGLERLGPLVWRVVGDGKNP